MDLSKFKDIFISEVEDHLQKLNDNLLAYEKNPNNKELLDDLMRSAHTIKGSSASMGYNSTAYLTHVLEDVFDYARNGLLKLDKSIIDTLFSGFDKLDDSLKLIKKENKEIDSKDLIEKIKQITGVNTEGIGKSKRSEDGKPVVDGRDTPWRVSTKDERQETEDKSNNNPESIKIEKISSIKVPIERLDNLMDLTEELLIDRMKIESILENKSAKDNLVAALSPVIEHLNHLISNIQYSVSQARMVPIGQIFARFPRMVRDLSQKQNKNIDLEIIGDELELDRTIIDQLGEPIIHLLRNAIDHGITSDGIIILKAERIKDYIAVSVTDSGQGIDWVQIVKAATQRKIIDSSTEKDYLSQLDSNSQPGHQVFNLIFHPQLSTNQEVTETSGRGVGMNIVKNFIDSVGGEIQITSPILENNQKTNGSKFLMNLPISLAIINVLLVEVKENIFALPFNNINRIVKINPEHLKSMADYQVAIIDEQRVPIINLTDNFNLSIQNPDKNNQNQTKDIQAVLVVSGQETVGLEIDKILNETEITIKALPQILKGISGFSGSAILGSGRTILIVDVPSLIQEVKNNLDQ